MATQTLRSFVPALPMAAGAEALERTLIARGCRIERRIEHAPGLMLELQASLRPGMRLYSQHGAPAIGGAGAWILDETAPGLAPWDPSLAQALSAQLGAFAASAVDRRVAGQYGHRLYLAGRTIDAVDGEALTGAAYAAFEERYRRLTGSPAADLRWKDDTALTTLVVSGGTPPADLPQRRAAPQQPLALALFALAEEAAFADAWAAVRGIGHGIAPSSGWRWNAGAATASQPPYVVLARDGAADIPLCEALARHLDVPAAAIALPESAAGFAWWNVQPGQAAGSGEGRDGADLLQRLTAATIALGEYPGIVRV